MRARCPELTVFGQRFGRPLLRVGVPLFVLGLPGVVDLQPAVEFLAARRQQLDVCGTRARFNTAGRPSVAQAAGRARALTRRPVLTAGSVDGVPEVGVLPLAQLVFAIGAVGRFAGLNLRTSDDGDTEKTQKGRGKSALKKRRNPCPASIPEPRRGGGGRRPQKRRAHMSLAVWATPPTRKRRRMID